MANSKYEYVRSDYEVLDEIFLPNIIVVQIDGRDFKRFSEVHEFEKPTDKQALSLMDGCATAALDEYPDIVFAYGFSDEYSFVLKKTSQFYKRRSSKISSIIVSFFSTVYVMNWKEVFPHKELKYPPSFRSRVLCCASIEVLQSYVAWRQSDCHTSNQYSICFWNLVKTGKASENEAAQILKDAKKQDRNELLYQLFGINYTTNVDELLRQGSCVLKTKVEDVVKYTDDGTPVKRLRTKPILVHSKNVAAKRFWNDNPILLKEVGPFSEDLCMVKDDYIRSFQFENTLMLSTWIVIRIDGCHFHRFSEVHKFKKPNDEQALRLMNSCALAVLKEFQDIVLGYGTSDEYSFVLSKDSQLYQRRSSELVSTVVSFFSSMYIMKWKEFFEMKKLEYPPSFDGRAVCYPNSDILRDYLAWRQVDCHINNQYNTCFWNLVGSGKTKSEAQAILKGTQTREKNELLRETFSIEYNMLPVIFRLGSSVFWMEKNLMHENGSLGKEVEKQVVVEHCNIIDDDFWKAHLNILQELPQRCCSSV